MPKIDTTVKKLVEMIKDGELRLPEMQRRYVWPATDSVWHTSYERRSQRPRQKSGRFPLALIPKVALGASVAQGSCPQMSLVI